MIQYSETPLHVINSNDKITIEGKVYILNKI